MSAHNDTIAVHAGRQSFSELGVHAPPIDLSTTYPLGDLDEAAAMLGARAEGLKLDGNPIYARVHNPTVGRFEEALAELEGADEAVAFASGMAAITACLLAMRAQGPDHVVALRPLYGGTDHLLASELLGIKVSWSTLEALPEHITERTGLILVETPANPTLDVVDIERVVELAGGVPVLVDSTFATPILQRPLAHGATLALHSATKMIGGHGDVVAGVVACDSQWAQALRRVRLATGAILHPLAGYLLHRGLQTLPIRVRQAQQSAQTLVQAMRLHPDVLRVHYPGVDARGNKTALPAQMKGPGSIVALEVRGGAARCARLLGALKLMTPAVSLGSTDTLIQHPASLTHGILSPEERAQGGISDDLVRLSVGLEDVDDLIADLTQALDASALPHAALAS